MTTNRRHRLSSALVAILLNLCLGTPGTAQNKNFPGAPPGWQTYRSPDYGFSVDYPDTMTFYLGHPSRPEQRSYLPVCEDSTVGCFVYSAKEYEGTTLQAAGLSVNVIRDKRTEQGCNKISEAWGPEKTATINGLVFHVAQVGGAASNHREDGSAYQAFYQNVCFQVKLGIATVDAGVFDPGTIKQADPSDMEDLLDHVLHTFRFTGDVTDGPGWKTYRDSGCGGAFEYPDGDTVVVKVQFSNARVNSDEITCAEAFSDRGFTYTVVAKSNLRYENDLNIWLKSFDYTDLSKAHVALKQNTYTEYVASPYVYIFGQAKVYILSVSDSNHKLVDPIGNRVFTHLLNSFKGY